MDQQQIEQNQMKIKEFPHYDILFKYQNPGKMKKIKNIDTQILKCFVTDQDTDQTIQLSFPRKWLSIDNLSLVNVLKKILNILTDYIHSQYDEDHIQQIFQQSFQDSHNINLNLPTDPEFIHKIHQDIIIVDQQLIEKHRPYCGICQESLKINESVIKLPCRNNEKDNPHFFHTGKNIDICPGLKPWLKHNNSCPVCRFQLPSQQKSKKKSESESDSDSESDSELDITQQQEQQQEQLDSDSNSDSQQELEIDPIVQQLTFERETITEQEIVIIFSLIDKIYQRYQPCQNPQCDLNMCIEERKRKEIDQQEEILMDEAIRISLNQDNQTYLDDQLIQEQQKLFQESEQDYIDQIIQMTVLQESLPNNQNMFLNLQDEDSEGRSSPNYRDDRQSPHPSIS